jgi:hypothetical protein
MTRLLVAARTPRGSRLTPTPLPAEWLLATAKPMILELPVAGGELNATGS